jgi:hypothetical protein
METRIMGDYYEAALRNAYAKDEQRLWLEDIVNRLSGCRVWKYPDVMYWNHPELPEHLRSKGYSVCFQSADRDGHPLYVMVSRSHTDTPVSLQRIIDDLCSKEIVLPFVRFGEYYAQPSKRRGPGKHATIKFGSRWYMLSVSGRPKPYYRLTRPAKTTSAKSELTYEVLKERQQTARAKFSLQAKAN